MPKFFLGFLAGIVAFAAVLGALFGVDSFTRLSGVETVEDTPAPTAAPSDLAALMAYRHDPWKPHGDKLSLHFNPDEIPHVGGQIWPLVFQKVQPVKALQVSDIDRICIASIWEDQVSYGFELWEETQDALLQEFRAELDLRRDGQETGHTVYILDSLQTRIGQIRMDDQLANDYQGKLAENRDGLDFTVRMDIDMVYWFQPTIAEFSEAPVAPCDDSINLARFPTYQALMHQFWEVEEPRKVWR